VVVLLVIVLVLVLQVLVVLMLLLLLTTPASAPRIVPSIFDVILRVSIGGPALSLLNDSRLLRNYVLYYDYHTCLHHRRH